MTGDRSERLRFDLTWLKDAARTVFDALAHQPWLAPGETRDGIERRSVRLASPLSAEISYLTAGDPSGRRVLLVHGSPSQAEDWLPWLRSVPAGQHWLAVDRPGFGCSGPQDTPTDLGVQAAALRPLLRDGVDGKTVLVGRSMGAPVAVRAALDFPDLVGGVLLIGGALSAELERVHWLQRVAARPAVARLLPRVLRNSNSELIALKAQLADLAPRLESLRAAVTVVHGTADPLVPYATVDFLERTLTGSVKLTVVRVADGDHFLAADHHEAVVRRALQSLVAELERTGT
ncbi:alpha/beta fold hydrolase [Azospirillum sp. sgz302134]